MSKRAPHYSANPDAVYVSIYCAGNVVASAKSEVEQSHEDDPWFIASYLRQWYPEVGEAGAWLWVESTSYWRDHRPTIDLRSGKATQSLSGDRYVSADDFQQDIDVFESGDSRTRYRFECQTCGLTIERKDPAVSEAFDKLAGIGKCEVTLRGLGAIL